MNKTRAKGKPRVGSAFDTGSLRYAIFRITEDGMPSVHCRNIGAEVYRDPYGDLEFQVTGQGGAEYSVRFKDLMAGPCAGYRGESLESRIKKVMYARLAGREPGRGEEA